MNMSLKEYDMGSTYGICRTKHKKRTANNATYGRHAEEVQDDYRLVVQQGEPSVAASIGLTGFSYPACYRANRANREIVVLNGERYELVGKIVTGGMIQSVVVRAALNESIDDGTIDYNRLTTRVTRKQSSNKSSSIHKVAQCNAGSEIVHGTIPQFRMVDSKVSTPSSRNVILSITGTLADKTAKYFTIDWYGGSKLTIDRSRAEGDWDQLKIGQWIEATISRRTNGEVVSAMLVGTIDVPRGFSEEELADSYSSIPAAQLDPA